jgi:hypothetical protein
MEFLSNLNTDVKLLFVGAALALVAALLSGSKKKEHRYMAVFTVLMVGAGYRIHQEGSRDASLESAGRYQPAAVHAKRAPTR